ncbi:MAG: M28 family metallopeptidase [Gemmatimonadales bacterium]
MTVGCWWSAALLVPVSLAAQVAAPPRADPWAVLLRPRTHVPTPTTAAITAADLRTRLFIFADDSMMGREAGTEGNVKGVDYIAHELKRIGLLPAGQDGTYFQTFVHHETVRWFDSTHTIAVDGAPLMMWRDYLPRDPVFDLRPIDGAQVIFGGDWTDSNSVISNAQATAKFVVITSSATYPGNPPHIPDRSDVEARFSSAAGIAVAELEHLPDSTLVQYRTPVQFLSGRTAPIYMYVTRAAAERLLGEPVEGASKGATGKTVTGNLGFGQGQVTTQTDRPLRNVVALLEGSDPVLRNEFVVLGAHNDHIGTVGSGMSDVTVPMAHDSIYVVDHLFRQGGADDPPPTLDAAQQQQVNAILARVRKASGGRSARIDSIFNGADDDGSGSVSLLEIAQYFAAQRVKPKRSLLFVWHVGEEKGLWGSEYFTDHPTVPRDSIVAELNMDMIGRGGAADQTGYSIDGRRLHGGPGYLQVVGSRRLSTELGDLVEAVNTSGAHGLHFDYSMDASGHPQQIYCRSDHAEYARYGIPIAFFTTGGHADYHQLTDEPQYIDYNRMAQVDNFIADLARHVANLGHRVAVDHPRPDPKAPCQQ